MDKMLELFAAVRPDAVALVDAYDYPDHVLQSCLGRYDGNVYEALYQYAKDSPLNKQDVGVSRKKIKNRLTKITFIYLIYQKSTFKQNKCVFLVVL